LLKRAEPAQKENMNRELKARIWDGNNKHFVYPEILELNAGLEYQLWTGLKDSYATEEYFGDIIEDVLGERWLIEDGYSAVLFTNIKTNEAKYSWELPTHKVIGNIWENPELLETK
jgi:hypothetical protein